MASQSDIAAAEAGKGVSKAILAKLAPELKKRYLALRSSHADLREPKDNDPEFNNYIIALGEEIIEGATERSQKLRATLKQLSADNYADLEKGFAIRAAATQSVKENTGDFEFLGGSTIGNALAGLGKWLFSGGNFLEKIGELFSFIFSGFDKSKMPAGLRQTIAERAVGNTVGDFKAGMEARGVDTNAGVGQEALAKFEQQAKLRASGAPVSPDAPIDLSGVKVAGLVGAPAPDGKPQNLEGVLSAIAKSQLEGELKGKELDDAIGAFTRVASGIIKNDASLVNKPEELAKKVAAGLLADSEVGPQLKKKLAEKGLKEDALLTLLTPAFTQNQKFLADAAAGKASEEKVAKLDNTQANRDLVKQAVHKKIDEKTAGLTAEAIYSDIDARIKSQVNTEYTTNPDQINKKWAMTRWLWAQSNRLAGDNRLHRATQSDLPTISERQGLAQHVHQRMPTIFKEEMNKIIDGGKTATTASEIAAKVKERFAADLRTAINEGKVSKVWAQYVDELAADVERKTVERLDPQTMQLLNEGLLKANGNKTVASVQPQWSEANLGGLKPIVWGQGPGKQVAAGLT